MSRYATLRVWLLCTRKVTLHTRLDVHKCMILNWFCGTRVHMCTRTKEHRTKPWTKRWTSGTYDKVSMALASLGLVGACIVRRDPMIGEALRANGWAERGFASGGARSEGPRGVTSERSERVLLRDGGHWGEPTIRGLWGPY